MDAFKQTEIERMRLGGNENWKKFFDEHEDTKMRGLTWDDATIAERYNGAAGEEWKERLSAKVEGKEYVPSERKPAATPANNNLARSATPLSGTASGNMSQSPSGATVGKTKVDDKYFESLGNANASRPDNLPPSQGGKYAGFGSTSAPAKKDDALPKFEELQKDPLAALTKGFGWFSSTVTKTASSVNKDFIQPTAKQVRLQSISDPRISTVLTPKKNYSLENRTLQPKRELSAAVLRSRHSREHEAHRMVSLGSSKALMAEDRLVPIIRPWMRTRKPSGTILHPLQTSERQRAVQSVHLPWAWGARRALLEEQLPERKMNGMTGDANRLGRGITAFRCELGGIICQAVYIVYNSGAR